MQKKAYFLFLITIFIASISFAVPDYQARVAGVVPDTRLSIDCIIEQPVTREVLEQLAAEVYKTYNGQNFQNVFMMWYLPSYKIGSGAWATTNYNAGKLTVSIPKLQRE